MKTVIIKKAIEKRFLKVRGWKNWEEYDKIQESTELDKNVRAELIETCINETLKVTVPKDVLREKKYSVENPYPKDIFKWDNKEIVDFNRGRFNQHCFEVAENCRNKIFEELLNSEGDSVKGDCAKGEGK